MRPSSEALQVAGQVSFLLPVLVPEASGRSSGCVQGLRSDKRS